MPFVQKVKKIIQIIICPYYLKMLMRYRVAASTEHDWLLRSQRFDLVFDVGANRGQFSLAVRRWNSRARIVAFEPLGRAAQTYRSVFANDRAATCFTTAISSQSGPTIIHVSRRDDSSSLMPITAIQSRIFPGTEEAATEVVEAASLDSFASEIGQTEKALLKIDVQGFELHVLRSAENVLPLFSMIYVELSFIQLYEGQPLADEIITYLHEHNFILVGIYNLTYDTSTQLAVQGDFLFRRSQRADNVAAFVPNA